MCALLPPERPDGVRWLKLPYKREDGKTDVFRKRYGAKSFAGAMAAAESCACMENGGYRRFRKMVMPY